MNVLAVESSTKACSVCLMVGEKSYLEYELAPQKHANLMLPMVEKVMQDAGLDADKIDLLAYSEGPGAFTGIRIATGVIQGLGLGWQKPVLAVSTLEALAWQGYQKTAHTNWLACLDARMNEIYIQSCSIIEGVLSSTPAQLVSEAMMLETIEQQALTHGIGDIAQEYPNAVVRLSYWEDAYPKADAIASLAAQKQQQQKLGKQVSDHIPLPVYLRNNVADKQADQNKVSNKPS